MTGPARTLPVRPSLRPLKAEAGRRAKSGEFSRSMMLSWPSRASMASRAGLGSRKLVCGQSQPQSRALSRAEMDPLPVR